MLSNTKTGSLTGCIHALLKALLAVLLLPVSLPAQNLAPAAAAKSFIGSGLQAEYYNGTNFLQKAHSRIDKEINFYHLYQSPAPGVNQDFYSIRWTGYLYPPTTGRYKLSIRVDDGVRVWLDDQVILDQWKLQDITTYTGELALTAERFYKIKIEYYNGPLHGVLQLLWQTPPANSSGMGHLVERTALAPIPSQYLFARLPRLREAGAADAPEKQTIYAAAPTPANPIKQEQHQREPAGIVEIIGTAKPNAPIRQNAVAIPVEAPSQAAVQKPATKEAVVMNTTQADVYENLARGSEIRFNNVQFEQGKYSLLKDSYAELDKLVRTMLKKPALSIRIEGHTDDVGNPSLNQSLSFFRAKVVATYLIEQGVPASRIEVKGYGSSQPLSDNSTEAGRSLNRRVQFVVK